MDKTENFGHAGFWARRRECRAFVPVSRVFLGRFQKFKDLVVEHIKVILMNPVALQSHRQKTL